MTALAADYPQGIVGSENIWMREDYHQYNPAMGKPMKVFQP
jgi:hypothetical protein